MDSLASIVVASHLSDLQIEVGMEQNGEIATRIQRRLDFCKYLIIKLDGNLEQRIDPDKMYSEFLLSRGVKVEDPIDSTPKGKLISYVKRIANGEKVTYGLEPNMLSVDGISADDIVSVIEELDESGKFEGYLDGNGVDQDWSFDMNIGGIGIEMWGSITGANCQLQSM